MPNDIFLEVGAKHMLSNRYARCWSPLGAGDRYKMESPCPSRTIRLLGILCPHAAFRSKCG